MSVAALYSTPMYLRQSSARQRRDAGLLALSLTSLISSGCSSIGSVSSSPASELNGLRFARAYDGIPFEQLPMAGDKIAAAISDTLSSNILRARLIVLNFNPMWEGEKGPRLLFVKFDPDGKTGQVAAKLAFAKECPGNLLDVETVQIGPQILGNYAAKEAEIKGRKTRELSINFDTFIACGTVRIQQPLPTPLELSENFNAGAGKLAVSIEFHPTIVGTIFGLKRVEMVDSITTQIRFDGVVGGQNESLGDLIKSNLTAFKDSESCAQLSNGAMLEDSKLAIKCDPDARLLPTIVEDWFPIERPHDQKVIVAQLGDERRRIMAVSERAAFCPDTQSIFEPLSKFSLISFDVSLLRTHANIKSCPVFAMTDSRAGADRRVEIWDGLPHEISSDVMAFIDGVRSAEQEIGTRIGGLVVRVLKAPSPETSSLECVDCVSFLGEESLPPEGAELSTKRESSFERGRAAAINALLNINLAGTRSLLSDIRPF